MKDYFLSENQPAEKFSDAYYLGNGRMGMTVFGGVPHEEITINDDTLWSGCETFHENPQHYDKMVEARGLTLEGKVKEANNIINDEMEGRWMEAYLPLASIHITVGQKNNRRNMPLRKVIHPQEGEISNYKRSLDLSRAVSEVTWSRGGIEYCRKCFVSYPQDTAFVYCAAKGSEEKVLNMAFGVDSKLHFVNGTYKEEAFLTGIAPDHAEPDYTPVEPRFMYGDPETSNSLRIACCARVVSCDGNVFSDGQRVYINDASFVLIAVKAKTNYAGFEKERDPDAGKLLTDIRAELDMLQESKVCYEDAIKEHIEDYQNLYGEVDVDLGKELTGGLPTSQRLAYYAEGVDDASMAGLFLQYSRYLTIAGSRPGSQPLNLQGIWNDTTIPPWSSNYTNNINVEMNYWPCEVLGLSQCHLPLMDMLRELSIAGQKTAKEYYHLNGWVAHHNTDLWRSSEPSSEDACWSWWPFGGAWMCEHIWTHYEYTGDKEFLREMYPTLKGAAIFMLGFLVRNEDGYLVTAPSISPENKFIIGNQKTVDELVGEIAKGSRCSPNHPQISAVTQASTMDMSILRELFQNTVHAAQILESNEDPVLEQLTSAMKQFPPYKTGKYGQLLEWYYDYEECTPGMGHISHLYPVYPANLIMEETSSELMKAAYRSVERRMLHAREEESWTGAWKVSLMARFKNALECGRLLKSTGATLGASLIHGHFQQIDVAFGLGAGVAEMLLQSHRGFVEILPTIPVDWNRGSFRGIRARGGFKVSAEWEKCCIVKAMIFSEKDGLCRVKAEGLGGVEGVEYLWDVQKEVLEFQAKAGMTYSMLFKDKTICNQEYFI